MAALSNPFLDIPAEGAIQGREDGIRIAGEICITDVEQLNTLLPWFSC